MFSLGDMLIGEIEKLKYNCTNCTKCDLHKTKTNTVFGDGNINAKYMFVGEGPGETEDLEGKPFVGRAGKLLTNMIKSMGLEREEVYISNIVHCRPPGNRKPTPEEVEKCLPYLESQIGLIKPKVIITLGNTATDALCGAGLGITKRHGGVETYNNTPVVPTFHPSFLLRKPTAKELAWYDLQKAKDIVENRKEKVS